jgi:hypothetical protein
MGPSPDSEGTRGSGTTGVPSGRNGPARPSAAGRTRPPGLPRPLFRAGFGRNRCIACTPLGGFEPRVIQATSQMLANGCSAYAFYRFTPRSACCQCSMQRCTIPRLHAAPRAGHAGAPARGCCHPAAADAAASVLRAGPRTAARGHTGTPPARGTPALPGLPNPGPGPDVLCLSAARTGRARPPALQTRSSYFSPVIDVGATCQPESGPSCIRHAVGLIPVTVDIQVPPTPSRTRTRSHSFDCSLQASG